MKEPRQNTTTEKRSTRTNECSKEKRKDYDLPRQEKEHGSKKRQKAEVLYDSNMPSHKKHPKKEATKTPRFLLYLVSELL